MSMIIDVGALAQYFQCVYTFVIFSFHLRTTHLPVNSFLKFSIPTTLIQGDRKPLHLSAVLGLAELQSGKDRMEILCTKLQSVQRWFYGSEGKIVPQNRTGALMCEAPSRCSAAPGTIVNSSCSRISHMFDDLRDSKFDFWQ